MYFCIKERSISLLSFEQGKQTRSLLKHFIINEGLRIYIVLFHKIQKDLFIPLKKLHPPLFLNIRRTLGVASVNNMLSWKFIRELFEKKISPQDVNLPNLSFTMQLGIHIHCSYVLRGNRSRQSWTTKQKSRTSARVIKTLKNSFAKGKHPSKKLP